MAPPCTSKRFIVGNIDIAMSGICADVRGRQLGSAAGVSAEDRPKPLPRQKRLQDDDDLKSPIPASRTSPHLKSPVPASRPSPNVLDHKMLPTRKTPTNSQQVAPDDRRNLPADDRDLLADRHQIHDDDREHRYSESRRSPLDRHDFTDRKSPYSGVLRKSPLDRREFESGKELFEGYGASRKSPTEGLGAVEGKSPLADRRPSSVSRGKSPFEGDVITKAVHQKSPADDRKSPMRDLRKTPVSFQRTREDSLSTQRKGSVVDLLTESTGVKERESSDEKKDYRARRKSGSPQTRGPSVKRSGSTEKNPFDNIRKSPGAAVTQASKHGRTDRSPHRQVICCCCVSLR